MTTLANFPLKNQLADISEINREFDCVPTAIAACLEWLLKRPFDGGAIKDAVYGQGYTGATSAERYIAYCQEQGVKLFALDGQPAQLVQDIRSQIGKEIPLIGTEPDPYANPSLGWSHVVAFYGCDEPPGTLTALDPYGGHSVTLSDAEWQQRLEFNQVWALERTSTLGTPLGWTDDGYTLVAPNSIPVVRGFREYILSNPWESSNIPLEAEHGMTQLEVGNPSLGGGTSQAFRITVLEWTPDRGVFEMWVGQEIIALRKLASAATTNANTSEIMASAKLIEETAQHIMDTASQHI